MCVTMGVTVRHPHTEQVMSDNPAADKDWEGAEFRAQVRAKLPGRLSPGTLE